MLIGWITDLQRRGDAQLHGRRIWAWAVPCVLLFIYTLERIVATVFISQHGGHTVSGSVTRSVGGSADSTAMITMTPIDVAVHLIADSKYAGDPLLFEVWQLWSYTLFHDDFLQMLMGCIFIFPVLAYWERVCGQVYMMFAMLVLIPASSALYLGMGAEVVGQIGISALVPALYGGCIFRGRATYVHCRVLTLWGSRIGLRRLQYAGYAPLLVYVLLEVMRVGYVTREVSAALYVIGNSIAAVFIGSSLMTVVMLTKRLLSRTSERS